MTGDRDKGNTSAQAGWSKTFIFKYLCLFINLFCMIQIANTKIEHLKDLDVVNPITNLLEYCENYGKTTGILY